MVSPEKHPSDGDCGECPSNLEEFSRRREPFAFSHDAGGVLSVGSTKEERDEEQGVDAAPNDEGPIGPMPKP